MATRGEKIRFGSGYNCQHNHSLPYGERATGSARLPGVWFSYSHMAINHAGKKTVSILYINAQTQ